MSRVYRAVNLMQRTPWHINPGILALVERLWSEGHKVGKLPLGLQKAVPERLPPKTGNSWKPMTRRRLAAGAA
jgi:DNA-directed RNA polymerase